MDIHPFFYGIPALTIASYMIDEVRSEMHDEIDQVRHEMRQSKPVVRPQRIVTNLFRDGYRDNFE